VALQAGEYAKDHGKFHEFHDRIFRSYFQEMRDIGDADLVMALAAEVGLDVNGLQDALQTNRYEPQLEEARLLAARYSVQAVPTFILGEDQKIVGAQSLDVFRKRLKNTL
jgi:predicted DsbA family dithiol-disulfide isomerase